MMGGIDALIQELMDKLVVPMLAGIVIIAVVVVLILNRRRQ